MNERVVVQPTSLRAAPIRVLVADSDERLLAALRILQGDEFELVTARSGVQCVARLRECVPDVLVLEPRLPWGGGDGVLAFMHEVAELAAIPVMILTSCPDVGVLKSVAPFPISDYRVKPVTPVELATRIRNVLHYRSLRAASADEDDGLKCGNAGQVVKRPIRRGGLRRLTNNRGSTTAEPEIIFRR